mgnify:CR=1 FL=1
MSSDADVQAQVVALRGTLAKLTKQMAIQAQHTQQIM